MDEFPKCTVCFTAYKYRGPKPKLLPCLHSVCYTCSAPDGATLTCQICQKSFDTEGVTLPTDTIRLAYILQLTSKLSPTEFLCTHKEDGNQAVSWCQDCEEFFCEYCQNVHDEFKLTRKHKVKGIGDLCNPGEIRDVSGETYCPQHDRLFEIYDDVCERLLCYRCFRDEHVCHKTRTADEYLNDCRKELEICLDKMKNKQKDISDLISSTHQLDKELDEREATLTDNIQQTFLELRTTVNQREKIVLTELCEALDHLRNANITRQSFLRSSETACSTAHEYLRLAVNMSSAADLHGLMKCVKRSTQGCIDTSLPRVHRNEGSLLFSKEGLRGLKEDAGMFGSIGSAVSVSVVSELSGEVGPHEKMKQSIEELKNEVREEKARARQAEDEKVRLKEDFSGFQQMVKELGLEFHQTAVDREQRWLCWLDLSLDSGSLNRQEAYIDSKGALVSKSPEPKHEPYTSFVRYEASDDFRIYSGTRSNIPLTKTNCHQYWETQSFIQVNTPIARGALILELGLCKTSMIDSKRCVGEMSSRSSISMSVMHCNSHRGICRKVRQKSSSVSCFKDTLPNKTGCKAELHYGVVYDAKSGKAAFIDVGKREVISPPLKLSVNSREVMWPMFGVFSKESVSVTTNIVRYKCIGFDERRKLIATAFQ